MYCNRGYRDMKKLTLDRSELLVELQASEAIPGTIWVNIDRYNRLSLRMQDGVLIINTEYYENLSQRTNVKINGETIKIKDSK